jgi:DNA-binding NarL/FixJ family response regulator
VVEVAFEGPAAGGRQAIFGLGQAAVKEEMPQVPILIMSVHEGHAMARELSLIGVQGFVSKTDAAQKLPEAIDTLLAGGTFFEAVTT